MGDISGKVASDIHSLFQQFKALYVAVGFSVGFTFKEFIAWVIRTYRVRREHKKDNQIAEYLVKEWIADQPRHDGRGSVIEPWRSTIYIAEHVGVSAVEVRARLIRLHESRRVDRAGTQGDRWMASSFELHDWQQRTGKQIGAKG